MRVVRFIADLGCLGFILVAIVLLLFVVLPPIALEIRHDVFPVVDDYYSNEVPKGMLAAYQDPMLVVAGFIIITVFIVVMCMAVAFGVANNPETREFPGWERPSNHRRGRYRAQRTDRDWQRDPRRQARARARAVNPPTTPTARPKHLSRRTVLKRRRR